MAQLPTIIFYADAPLHILSARHSIAMVKGSDSENAADNVLSFVLDQTQLPALGGARCPSMLWA